MYPTTNNKAFRAAYEKGIGAAREDVPREDNPYLDWRTDRGSVTFSRAFRRYWFRGWDDYTELVGGTSARNPATTKPVSYWRNP